MNPTLGASKPNLWYKPSLWAEPNPYHVYCYGVSLLGDKRLLLVDGDGDVLGFEGDGLHGGGRGALRRGGHAEPGARRRERELLRLLPDPGPRQGQALRTRVVT